MIRPNDEDQARYITNEKNALNVIIVIHKNIPFMIGIGMVLIYMSIAINKTPCIKWLLILNKNLLPFSNENRCECLIINPNMAIIMISVNNVGIVIVSIFIIVMRKHNVTVVINTVKLRNLLKLKRTPNSIMRTISDSIVVSMIVTSSFFIYLNVIENVIF